MLERIAIVATLEIDRVGRSSCDVMNGPYPPEFHRWIDQRLFRVDRDVVVDVDLGIVRSPRRLHVAFLPTVSGEFGGTACDVRSSLFLVPSTRTVDVVIEFVPLDQQSIEFDESIPIGDLVRMEVIVGRTMEIREAFTEAVTTQWPAPWAGVVADPECRTTFGWVGMSAPGPTGAIPASATETQCPGVVDSETFAGGRNHIRVRPGGEDRSSWIGHLLLAAHSSRARHLRNRISAMVSEAIALSNPHLILEAATGVHGEVVLVGSDLRGVGLFGDERMIALLARCHADVVLGERELAEVDDAVAGLDRYANAVFQLNVDRAQRRFSVAGLMFATISLAIGTLALLDIGRRGTAGVVFWVSANVVIAIALVGIWKVTGRQRRRT